MPGRGFAIAKGRGRTPKRAQGLRAGIEGFRQHATGEDDMMARQKEMIVDHLGAGARQDRDTIDQMLDRGQNLGLPEPRQDLGAAQKNPVLRGEQDRPRIADAPRNDLDRRLLSKACDASCADPFDRLRPRIQRQHLHARPQILDRDGPRWRLDLRAPGKANERRIHARGVDPVIFDAVEGAERDRTDIGMMRPGRDRVVHQPGAPGSVGKERHLDVQAGMGHAVDHHRRVGVKRDLLRIERQMGAKDTFVEIGRMHVVVIVVIDRAVGVGVAHGEFDVMRRVDRMAVAIGAEVILIGGIIPGPYTARIPAPGVHIRHFAPRNRRSPRICLHRIRASG